MVPLEVESPGSGCQEPLGFTDLLECCSSVNDYLVIMKLVGVNAGA